MAIYIACRGDTKPRKVRDGFVNIFTGADILDYHHEDISHIVYDNTSNDNISNKNEYYAELTALYWIWKNDNDCIKGLVHYRRLFVSFFPFPHYSTYYELKNYLNDYDVIVSQPKHFKETVRKQLEISVEPQYIELLETVILEMYPEYMPSLEAVMNSHGFSPFNIMVAKSNEFNSYCSWLFSILFEMEKRVIFEDLQDNQIRLLGYLSERMMPIWIHHNKLRTKIIFKYNTDSPKILLNKIKMITKKD